MQLLILTKGRAMKKISLLLVPIFLTFSSFAGGVNLDELERIEFSYLNKATKTNWRNTDVSFGSKNENISHIIKKILKPTGKEVIGLERLDGLHRTVMMKKVKAHKALTILLKCEGFKITEEKTIFVIFEDRSIDRNACLF